MTDPRIATLIANRSLATRDQVRAFDAALAELARGGIGDLLDELFLVLIDDTEDQEVMWGVIHVIEAAPPEVELAALFRVLPALADQAPEWVMILHYRLINEPTTRARYAAVLADATPAAIESARDILEVITEDTEPALRAGALEILAALPPR